MPFRQFPITEGVGSGVGNGVAVGSGAGIGVAVGEAGAPVALTGSGVAIGSAPQAASRATSRNGPQYAAMRHKRTLEDGLRSGAGTAALKRPGLWQAVNVPTPVSVFAGLEPVEILTGSGAEAAVTPKAVRSDFESVGSGAQTRNIDGAIVSRV